MRFTEKLKEQASNTWDSILTHPFVLELKNGTLTEDRYKFYTKQHYVYLLDLSRAMALGIVKAYDAATVGKFAQIVECIVNTEMVLHRQQAAKFEISSAQLTAVKHAPTTYAYTRHLLYVAFKDDLEKIICALIPAFWTYADIAADMFKNKPKLKAPCTDWVKVYYSKEFQGIYKWFSMLLEKLLVDAREEDLYRCKEQFMLSLQYELKFWDMAYQLEEWPR